MATIIGSNFLLPAAASRNTVNVDTAGQVPIERYDISAEIYEKNITAQPYLVLLQQLGGKMGWNDTHMWNEDIAVTQRDSIDGSVATTATTITVANGAVFTVRDNVYFHTYRATFHVTAKVGNVLTGVWVVAPAVNIPDGTACVRVGNSQEQIATPTPGPTMRETEHYNYFQTMFHEVAFSVMHMNGKFRTNPGDPARQQRKALEAHKNEKEKTLLFGQRALRAAGTSGGSPLGHSQGLYYYTATNVTSVGAVLTRATFDTFLHGVMSATTHPDQDWWFLCSSRIASQISGWFSALEREKSSQTLFGTRVDTYRAPVLKDVKIVVHPMFAREGWDDLGILINVGEDVMKYVYHTVLNTRRYTATQPNGRTAIEIFFWTTFCLEAKGEEINYGVIEDVAAAA